MADYSAVRLDVWPWPDDDAELRRIFKENGYDLDVEFGWSYMVDIGEAEGYPRTLTLHDGEARYGSNAFQEANDWSDADGHHEPEESITAALERLGLNYDLHDYGCAGVWESDVTEYRADGSRREYPMHGDEAVIHRSTVVGWLAEMPEHYDPGFEYVVSKLIEALGITDEMIEAERRSLTRRAP